MNNYSIIFDDGTVYSGLRLSGNNFISSSPPPEGYENKLSSVEIHGPDPNETYTMFNAAVVRQWEENGEYRLILREQSQEELRRKELEDTVQMLTDCLLEMSETVYA